MDNNWDLQSVMGWYKELRVEVDTSAEGAIIISQGHSPEEVNTIILPAAYADRVVEDIKECQAVLKDIGY